MDISHFRRLPDLEALMARRSEIASGALMPTLYACVVLFLAGPIFHYVHMDSVVWFLLIVFVVLFSIVIRYSRPWRTPRCSSCHTRMKKVYLPTQYHNEKIYLVCFDCKTKAYTFVESTG